MRAKRRITLARLLIVVSIILTGCAGMPLTTMYKLHRLDPMEADPAQLKVAIRADERIGIREGGATIEVKFNSEDGTVNIDDTFIIEVIRNPIINAGLLGNNRPGESVTVLQLTETDAQRFRLLQSSLEKYQQQKRKGSGSFGVGISGICFVRPMPGNDVVVDIFLQTSADDGFYVLVNKMNLREKLEGEGQVVPEWPDCAMTEVGRAVPIWQSTVA